MATKRSNRYTRATVSSKLHETLGEDSVEYYLDEDGQPFHVPHPFFYDRATKDALKELPNDDEEGRARVILGDEQFDRFVAEGGEFDEISKLNVNIQLDASAILSGGGPTKR